MADIMWVLHCFGCEEDTLTVNQHWEKAKMVKCGNCGTQNTIGSIEGAMKLAGKERKRHPTPATKKKT